MNIRTPNSHAGFSVIQLLITIAVIGIVCAFAFMGIVKARAYIRRANSARQFAAYIERARSDAIRRHDQTSIQQINATTYAVTMDFGGSGTVTTQNFTTERGVTLNIPLTTITFDWRGRTPGEQNVRFANVNELPGSEAVNISGSGDVTIDLEIFADGSVPEPTLNGTGGSVVPDATPTPDASPGPSASPTPTPSPSATATPTTSPTPTQSPTPTPTPGPTPNPTPTPTPGPTPTPTPTPVPCSISTSSSSITIAQNGSGTVSVHLNNFSGSGTITATSSNSGQIQVSPGSATVSGTNSASFTISVKKESGSVSFSSSCGTQSVIVTVQ